MGLFRILPEANINIRSALGIHNMHFPNTAYLNVQKLVNMRTDAKGAVTSAKYSGSKDRICPFSKDDRKSLEDQKDGQFSRRFSMVSLTCHHRNLDQQMEGQDNHTETLN